MKELMEFKEMHGHCHPKQGHKHQNLYNFLTRVRSGDIVDQEIEGKLIAIGWNRDADPAVERSNAKVTAHDRVMVKKLEEFYRKSSTKKMKGTLLFLTLRVLMVMLICGNFTGGFKMLGPGIATETTLTWSHWQKTYMNALVRSVLL